MIKLKIGWVVMRHGDLVRTGRIGAQTSKVYRTKGAAWVQARRVKGIAVETFIEVPIDD